MEKVKFAIIGWGGIAKTHAMAAYDMDIKLSLPYSVELKYVLTRKPVEIRIPGTQNVQDLSVILSDPEIKFVSICTPNAAHEEYFNACVNAGIPVYCEKPLSHSAEVSMRMAKSAEERGVLTGIPLIYRFLPVVRLMRNALAQGMIGDVIDFRGHLYHRSYMTPKKKGSWRTLPEHGGGASLDLCVHTIDLANFVLGEFADVKVEEKRIYFHDRSLVDEIARYSVTLPNGSKGLIEASRVFSENNQTDDFTVYGSKGSLHFNSKNPHDLEVYIYEDNSGHIIRASSLSKDENLVYPDERAFLGFFQSAHTACLAEFIRCVVEHTTSAHLADAMQCAKMEQYI